MVGIYKITNKINGKAYVGQSVHIEERWRQHKNQHSDSLIHQAIKKYGIDNFIFEVLEECENDKQILNAREEYWIKHFNTIKPNGYNKTSGGDNASVDIHYTKLDENIVNDIINDLLYSQLSQNEIALKYNISANFVSDINLGISHKCDNIDYPIRIGGVIASKFKCSQCGARISNDNKSRLCLACLRKTQRVAERPSREELKLLIRTTPFTKIGAMFSVSDNAIRKWCDAYNLPRKVTDIQKYTDEEWLNI